MAGATMASLSSDGSLTVPNVAGYTVPGTATEQEALGILHVNCGNCHNDTADGLVFPAMDARIKASDTDVQMTAVYQTMVNQTVDSFQGFGCNYRVAGNDVADSCVHFRMSERGDDATFNFNQMPPLGTDLVDTVGLSAIETWIGTLPAP